MSAAEPVRFSVDEGVASIRFNRPERLNALDVALAEGFLDATRRALASEARAILVSGEGRAFMAGGDLGFLRAAADRAEAAHRLIDPIHEALRLLDAAPVVTVGALQGAVAGAGLSIALNLDLAVMAQDAVLNLAYARVAAPPDCGGSWALPRLVGLRRALEIALLSGDLGAEEALRLGLVNRVAAGRDPLREATALARRLAKGPARAQGEIKALLRASLERGLGAQLDAEAAAFARCAATPDFGEALDAFFERRPPRFE